MDYQSTPNLLLEALAYLGRRAGGYTGQNMADRLRKRGVINLTPFWERFAPVGTLFDALNQCVSVTQRQQVLFTSLPGFPYSSIGAYSPAFLLFYPVLNRYHGNFSALLAYMRTLSMEYVAQHLLVSLDLQDDIDPDCSDPAGRLMAGIQSLDIPSDSKLTLLDCLHRYPVFLEETVPCLMAVLDELSARQDVLDACCRTFSAEVEAAGPDEYIQQTSSFSPPKVCHLHPFLFGLDTNLATELLPAREEKEFILYGGILRRCLLLEELSQIKDTTTAAYEAVKLMGDRTRFDILCFLRDHAAYGQELSDRFGLARNTIHHHMNKLSNAGLVTCTVEGNRVYYAIDKPSVHRLLVQQRKLLLEITRSRTV